MFGPAPLVAELPDLPDAFCHEATSQYQAFLHEKVGWDEGGRPNH